MPETAKHTKRKSGLSMLLPYFKSQKWILLALAMFALLFSAFEIITPYIIGRLVDEMAPGGLNFQALLYTVLGLAGFYALSAGSYYGMVYLSNRCALKMVENMRKDVFSKLQALSIRDVEQYSTGDYIGRFVNDASAVSDGIVQFVTHVFGGLITVVGTLVMMFVISPLVAITVVVITSVVYVVAGLITKYTNKYFKNQQQVLGDMGGLVDEITATLKTLKAFGYEKTAESRFEQVNNTLYTEGKKAVFYGSLYNPTTRFVNYLAYISVGVVGVFLAGLTPGAVSSFIIYSNQFAKPFQQITAVLAQVMTALAAAGRLNAVMQIENEPATGSASLPTPVRGCVEFKNVSFRYDPARPLIENFSFKVKAGQTVAIVGPTGAGKTTVVNLLMRFYDTYTGQILIDGVDIKSLSKAALRDTISMVLQETAVFNTTVRENIAYGRSLSDAEVESVADAAQAGGFIRRLPDGFDTVLAEDVSISEGQQQLLTIARAMVKPKKIVLLDEATSRVDVLTEQKITAAMERLSKGSTSFIIAHRLSTICKADVIIVMRDGAVVETGSHAELLALGGFYSSLWAGMQTE